MSHEDKTKDITKKTGDKVTAIKPNIPDKIATKLAGMVDITCRAVKDNGEYFISFKTDDVVFGGGRLKTPSEDIPNTFDAICKVYDEVNSTVNAPKKEEDVQQKETPVQQENPEKLSPAASEDVPRKEVTEETPVRTRRTRKVRE